MRKFLFHVFLVLFLLQLAPAQELTVAAAADLNYALKDLVTQFQKKTGNPVTLSFGASGSLFAQIESGAPYDLFFSADEDYPKRLAAAGLVESGSLRTYAVGHLVLWVSNLAGLDHDHLMDSPHLVADVLLQPSIKRIAIANPQTAPYGRAAMSALEHLGVKEKVVGKLVYGENVSQAAQFVQSGNAHAGLISLSLALSPSMKDSGRYWELPADSYPELRQSAVIVSASKHKKAAQAFLDYVTSADGAVVLRQYGFRLPDGR
jgi:molybdate transport system substrate-binding protein